jgi:hypothetical protein
MAIREALSKLLAPPSKIAHNLDWRKVSGSILSLRIGRNMINLAVASHPTFNEEVENLPSIDLKMTVKDNLKILHESTIEQLTSVVPRPQRMWLGNKLARPEGGLVRRPLWTHLVHPRSDHGPVEQYYHPQPPSLSLGW